MQNIRSVTPNRVMTYRLRNTGEAGGMRENSVLGKAHSTHKGEKQKAGD